MKYEETARRLNKALSDAGISQRELSERANIKESSVSHYINGRHAPSNLSSAAMAEVLGVNPGWLMGFAVPMRGKKVDTQDLIDATAGMTQDQIDKIVEYAKFIKSQSNN